MGSPTEPRMSDNGKKWMKYMGMSTGLFGLFAAGLGIYRLNGVGVGLGEIGRVGLYWALPITLALLALLYAMTAISRHAARLAEQNSEDGPE